MAVWTEGTFRAISPDDTWNNIQGALDAAGITRVADLSHLDPSGIAVHTACRPAATTIVMSQGKGINPLLSKISAVMESLELSYAETPIAAQVTQAPASAFSRDALVPLELLDLHEMSLVSTDTLLDWTTVTTVTSGIKKYLPVDCLRLDRRVSNRWEPPYFVKSTNGLASGNSFEEAILHGLCEVIERDAISRSSKSLTRFPIDPYSLNNDSVLELLSRIQSNGDRIRLFDLPTPVDIPCFAATLLGEDFGPSPFVGFGCHPESAIAATRAMTEAVQNRVTLIAGTRDDLPAWRYETVTLGQPRGEMPDQSTQSARLHHFSGDFPSQIDVIGHKILRVYRQEPCVARLSSTDDAVQVVRVIAPGLFAHDMSGLR